MLLFNENGSILVTTDHLVKSCQWCRVVCFDKATMRAHEKTATHMQKKNENPRLKKLSSIQVRDIIQANKNVNFTAPIESEEDKEKKKKQETVGRIVLNITD